MVPMFQMIEMIEIITKLFNHKLFRLENNNYKTELILLKSYIINLYIGIIFIIYIYIIYNFYTIIIYNLINNGIILIFIFIL